MRILIINLDHEKERLAFQQAQMARLGLEFERLPAIRGKDMEAKEMVRLASQWERPLRDSEVACLKSHQCAWRMIAEGCEPVLVLEDDAYLSTNTAQVLRALEQSASLDHVNLETRGRKKMLGRFSTPLTASTNLMRLYQDRTGAAAYVLWPHAAKILLEKSHRAAGLVDAILASAYELASFQVEPAAAMQLDQCEAYGVSGPLRTSTSIGTANHWKPSPKSSAEACKYRIRRMAAQLRMGLRQLSKVARAERRFVSIERKDFQLAISDRRMPR